MTTTSAMRILMKANIPFDTAEYSVDASDLSGVHAAQMMGLDPDCVFKTLVARGDKKGVSVFCIPVAEELDLKKCAAVTGDKRIEMIFIDEIATLFDRIYVSAGMRGQQIIIAPDDLLNCVEAQYADLTKR